MQILPAFKILGHVLLRGLSGTLSGLNLPFSEFFVTHSVLILGLMGQSLLYLYVLFHIIFEVSGGQGLCPMTNDHLFQVKSQTK